jgi:hypothetical protein
MDTIPPAVRTRLSHLPDAVVDLAWRMALAGRGPDWLRRELRLSQADATAVIDAIRRQRNP